jgi:ketosteroid isomerase-like protein
MTNETQIKERIHSWVKAVQERDYDGILAWHHRDIVMYDVPPPFQSVGIDAYRKTWDLFLSVLEKGAQAFQLIDLHIVAGEDVAFCYSPMKCVYQDTRLQRVIDLDFRLTVGFKKIDGQWWFVHEHHSVPSED